MPASQPFLTHPSPTTSLEKARRLCRIHCKPETARVIDHARIVAALGIAQIAGLGKSGLGAVVISAGELVAPQLRAAHAIAAVAFKRQNGRRQKSTITKTQTAIESAVMSMIFLIYILFAAMRRGA